MSFSSQIQEIAGVQLVELGGRLDSATSAELEKALQSLFAEPGRRVVIDFAALDYISSAGLRVVLMTAKRAKQGKGALLLCGLLPHVKEVFEISGFLKILDVVADRDAALVQVAA